jgi:N-acetylglucosaminyl-diphospho-decaprenol L-rhamnosyltransferase
VPVEVVIVSYNSAQRLPAAIESFVREGVERSRILVVDNNSMDGSAAVAKEAGARCHQLEENVGFGAACNRGLALCRTDIVVIANPDARCCAGSVGLLADALKAPTDTAIAGPLFRGGGPPAVRRFSTALQDITGLFPRRLQPLVRRYASDVALSPAVIGEAISADYVIGALFACNAARVLEIGGFDERFFLYSEEEDLCRRVRAAGWDVKLVTAANAEHDGTASSSGSTAAVMSRYRFRSRYLYYRKYRTRAYAEAARGLLAALVAADCAGRRVARRPPVYPWAAVWGAFVRTQVE